MWFFHSKISRHLKTPTEIQEIFYLTEKERSATKTLRFYNTIFLPTLLLQKIF